MHELVDYICDEMDELKKKVSKGGKLSSAEVEYLDMLAHTKKNLLTGEAMMESHSYDGSYNGSYNRSYENDGSYARGRNARRDSMGRYSRERGYSRDDFMDELQELMEEAPNDRVKQEFQRFMTKVQSM